MFKITDFGRFKNNINKIRGNDIFIEKYNSFCIGSEISLLKDEDFSYFSLTSVFYYLDEDILPYKNFSYIIKLKDGVCSFKFSNMFSLVNSNDDELIYLTPCFSTYIYHNYKIKKLFTRNPSIEICIPKFVILSSSKNSLVKDISSLDNTVFKHFYHKINKFKFEIEENCIRRKYYDRV